MCQLVTKICISWALMPILPNVIKGNKMPTVPKQAPELFSDGHQTSSVRMITYL